MKKRLLAMVCGCLFCGGIFAQHTWFNDKDLTLTGAYYYPEHWDESQWERDLKQMHELGFEFTHFAEFAWAQLEPQEGVYDFSWLDRASAGRKRERRPKAPFVILSRYPRRSVVGGQI